VHCRIEEAERRESRRPDRLAGFARYQIPRVHAHRGLAYDIEIDTSLLEPEAAAREVGRAIPALSRSAGDCCQP